MKGPRGSLAGVLDQAAKIAESRLRGVAEYCDDVATVDEPSTGGTLSNQAFRALLRGDESFAQHLAEKSPFMTPEERSHLRKTVEGLFPPTLPASVSAVPPRPWE